MVLLPLYSFGKLANGWQHAMTRWIEWIGEMSVCFRVWHLWSRTFFRSRRLIKVIKVMWFFSSYYKKRWKWKHWRHVSWVLHTVVSYTFNISKYTIVCWSFLKGLKVSDYLSCYFFVLDPIIFSQLHRGYNFYARLLKLLWIGKRPQ